MSIVTWLMNIWRPSSTARPTFRKACCPDCGKLLAITRSGKVWRHKCKNFLLDGAADIPRGPGE